MIVTYSLSLRSSAETIVIPPFTAGNDTALLQHIRKHCGIDYNKKQTFAHDYLRDHDNIIILMIHN